MRKSIILALALGAAASIASAQPQSATVPTKSESQAQSKESHGFVPYRDEGRAPTKQDRETVNSVTKANNAVSAPKSSGTSTGQQAHVPPQAVSNRNVKASPAN